jgi:DNA-directed RNA polymerase alpha subunit
MIETPEATIKRWIELMETSEQFGIRYAREKAEHEAAIKRWIELGLRTMTAGALANEWIRTLADLAGKSDAEILRIPCIGKLGLRDIRRLVPAPQKAT